MLDQLKRFDPDNGDLEQMIALTEFALQVRGGFEKRNIAVPEWITDKIRSLERAIQAATQDQKALRLSQIRAERQSLLSRSDRKNQLDQEEAELLKSLGQTQQ